MVKACFHLIVALTGCGLLAAREGAGQWKEDHVMVGAYYYPWYTELGGSLKWHRNAPRLRLDPVQEPMAGLYDSADSKLVAQHLEQKIGKCQ